MMAVEEAAVDLRTAPACEALGLPGASLYRGRRPAAVARPRPSPPRALDLVERHDVLDLLHTRFIDQAPAQVHATLLDEGTYLCSCPGIVFLCDQTELAIERAVASAILVDLQS